MSAPPKRVCPKQHNSPAPPEMVSRGSIFLKPGLPSDIYICPVCGFIEFWEHPTEMKKI